MTKETTADGITAAAVFNVRDFVDADKLKSDLAYSSHNLSDAMMQQASLFSHYGVLHAQASHQVDVVKMLLENTEAAVYKILRDDYASKGEKFTEPLLEKGVARHPRVIAMKKALNQSKRVEVVSKTAVEAFRHRRDMLVQMGLISREEMKGELRISERNVREDAEMAQRQTLLETMKRRRNGTDEA